MSVKNETLNETFNFICKKEQFKLVIDQLTSRSWKWTLSDESQTLSGKGGRSKDKTFQKVYVEMKNSYEENKAKRLIRNVQLKRVLGING